MGNDWDKNIEKVVLQIQGESIKYKLLHIKQSQKLKKNYNRLMLAGIIIGPISTITSTLETILDKELFKYFLLIIVLLNILTSILFAVVKFGKYDELSITNKQAASKYNTIENSIKRQLMLKEEDRIPSKPYTEWLENKYLEIFNTSPLLSAKHYSEKTLNINTTDDHNDKEVIMDIINDKLLEYEISRMERFQK